MDGQQLQNFKFVLGEVDQLTAQGDLVLGDVHRQVLHLIHVPLDALADLDAVGPAEGGADAGQQLGHAEGLDYIVVRPHVQGLYLL